MELLGVTGGVALELRVAEHGDPADLALGHVPPLVVDDAQVGADDRAAGGVGRDPQVGGGGRADQAGLGGVVAVVDDVAEAVHERESRRPAHPRAAGGHEAQLSSGSGRAPRSGRSMIRSSITGTTARPVARCSSTSARVASGSNLRRITTVQAMVAAMTSWPKPHAWNIGAATTMVCSAAPRDPLEHRGQRPGAAAASGARPSGCRSCPTSAARPCPGAGACAAARPGAASMSASSVCAPLAGRDGSSTQASTSTRSGPRSGASATMPANSSS